MPNGNGNGNGQHKDADGLTVKQALFCREYIRDRNASAACVRAGYSSKGRSVTGTRLLANPSVSAVVSRLAEAHLAKVEMDIDEMCLTASRIGRARVSQLFAPRVNGDDWTLLHPTELPDDVSEAVQSIEVHRDPDGGEHFKYKMHPKLQALDLIAKLRGLVAKKSELDVELTWRQVLEKMDAEDAEARAIEGQVKEVGSPSGTTTAGDRAQ